MGWRDQLEGGCYVIVNKTERLVAGGDLHPTRQHCGEQSRDCHASVGRVSEPQWLGMKVRIRCVVVYVKCIVDAADASNHQSWHNSTSVEDKIRCEDARQT